MKLVIATPLYPPEIGGPATYAELLFEGLPTQNITVELVKFSEVRHLPKIIRHYIYYRHVLRAARSADVVLALDPVSVGFPAMYAAQKAGKPLVVKVVGDYAWEQGMQRFGVTENLDEFMKKTNVSFPVHILRKIQTRVARDATRIIVPSDYLKSIVETWGIPTNIIKVIYNAVIVEEPGAVPEAVTKLSRPLVVTAGRLVPWKHIEGIIDAVARTSFISLVIVGDGPLRAKLESYASKKLPGRHHFTGVLSHKDTLAVIQSGDVFVLNSSYEGLSHLLVEAQELNVPTIATNTGGNPEVVTHEENGLLIPVDDTGALMNKMIRILGDEKLCRHLKAGMKKSAKRFSTETMLQATATTLHNL